MYIYFWIQINRLISIKLVCSLYSCSWQLAHQLDFGYSLLCASLIGAKDLFLKKHVPIPPDMWKGRIPPNMYKNWTARIDLFRCICQRICSIHICSIHIYVLYTYVLYIYRFYAYVFYTYICVYMYIYIDIRM